MIHTEVDYKEVRFDKYCDSCEYADKSGFEDPCDECLTHIMNLYSEKPVNFKEKEN